METSVWEQSSSVRSFDVDANLCVCVSYVVSRVYVLTQSYIPARE